jgi:hypothetical protein
MIKRSVVGALTSALLALPGMAHGQSIRVADSLLQSGSLASADSLFYAAARMRPRDPMARWALGRYLVGRGATRVGATLFEESLRFGGEPSIAGRDLVPVYLALGEFRPLAALSIATPTERARARWLASHPPRIVAPTAAITTVFQPSVDDGAVGHVPLRVNGLAIDAVVTSQVQGIVIADSGIARSLRGFGVQDRTAPSTFLAVADSIGIGRLSMVHYPVTINRLDNNERAAVGLDVFGRLASTFDPGMHRVTLHASGTPPAVHVAKYFTTWMAPSDVRIVQGGGWISVTSPQVAKMLREHRWTFDGRRGRLIVEP